MFMIPGDSGRVSARSEVEPTGPKASVASLRFSFLAYRPN